MKGALKYSEEGGILELFAPYGGNAYPMAFAPTFHRYRLAEPQAKKDPRNVFVCSMADMFGDWVPDNWIQAVFDACAAAPQHRYLFLTKNPGRYTAIAGKKLLPKSDSFWFGSTVTTEKMPLWRSPEHKTFVSIEPIHGEFSHIEPSIKLFDWAIIGAETGNRKGKIKPERKWIESIVEACRAWDTPVFMKNSLSGIWGEPLIQEYPWSTEAGVDA
jgi:protein gp37